MERHCLPPPAVAPRHLQLFDAGRFAKMDEERPNKVLGVRELESMRLERELVDGALDLLRRFLTEAG